MNILYCRPVWATPVCREIPFDWRDFEPLARAEASKFYWKQERGRFRFDDIYSEAALALATGKGVKHAIECIKGALKDFARDGDKLVADVELSAEEWRRTHSNIPAARRDMGSAIANAAVIAVAERAAKRIPPGTVLRVEDGVTYVSPGPYRSNAALLAGDGKVNSKHNKVPLRLGRSRFNDDWSQTPSGWVRAGSSDAQSEQEAARLAKKDQIPQRGELGGGSKPGPTPGYRGAGRKQRFSKSCLSSGPNAGIEGATLKSIPDFSPPGSEGDRFVVGPFLRIREPAKTGDRKVDPALSMWSRKRYRLCLGPEKSGPSYIPRRFAPPLLDVATPFTQFGLAPQNGPAGPVEARAIAKLLAEVPAEVPADDDKEPTPAEKERAKALALSLETPKVQLPSHWRATTPIDLSHVDWGPPAQFGVFIAADVGEFGVKKRPLRHVTKDIFITSREIPVLGGDYIRGGDPKPSRPQTTAAGSGSPTGRGALFLPPTAKPKRTRRTAIVVRLRPHVKLPPPVAPAQPLF